MPPDAITCERVDREDLDTRYLARTLEEGEAAAFEAHYFECDRCWRLVRAGTELKALREPGGATLVPPARARARWLRWSWVPLAAAAVLATIWLGGRGPARSLPEGDDAVRGPGEILPVATLTGGQLAVSWARTPDATAYQLRLFDASGSVVWERRIADTTIRAPRDSLPPLPNPLFAQVRALDLMGATIARSGLVDVASSPDGR